MLDLDPQFSVLPALVGTIFALVASVMAVTSASRKHREQQEYERQLQAHVRESLSEALQSALGQEASSGAPRQKAASEGEIRLLATRLDRLEKQFPAGAVLEKYASINDAILATHHEELARRMDRLESEAMTSGKVVVLLSTVLAVLFGMMAALPWILQQLAGSAG